MKMYWLYLEPYTFVFKGLREYLIYNTINGKFINVSNTSTVCSIIHALNERDSGYCISINEIELANKDLADFVDSIRYIFAGDIVECSDLKTKPAVLKPILRFSDNYSRTNSLSEADFSKNILLNVCSVVLYVDTNCTHSCKYCDSYLKQFLFCTNRNNLNQLSLNEYKLLFDKLIVANVNRLNIVCNDLSSLFFNELLLLLKEYDFEIHLYINYLNMSSFFEMDYFTDLEMHILVNFPIDDLLKNKYHLHNPKFKWLFVVSNSMEYSTVNELILEYNINAEIKPFYDGYNIKFFEDNVFINPEDIFDNIVSKRQIFARDILNENFFGNVIVFSDGSVYANLNYPALGNLRLQSLNELVFAELSDINGSWLMKRNKYPCSDCIYKLLCPSIGDYELVLDKENLCSIKRD